MKLKPKNQSDFSQAISDVARDMTNVKFRLASVRSTFKSVLNTDQNCSEQHNLRYVESELDNLISRLKEIVDVVEGDSNAS